MTKAPDNDCQPTSTDNNTIAGRSVKNMKQNWMWKNICSILCVSFDAKFIMWPSVTLERLQRLETRIYQVKHSNYVLRLIMDIPYNEISVIVLLPWIWLWLIGGLHNSVILLPLPECFAY
jgi:hypothetical protein